MIPEGSSRWGVQLRMVQPLGPGAPLLWGQQVTSSLPRDLLRDSGEGQTEQERMKGAMAVAVERSEDGRVLLEMPAQPRPGSAPIEGPLRLILAGAADELGIEAENAFTPCCALNRRKRKTFSNCWTKQIGMIGGSSSSV